MNMPSGSQAHSDEADRRGESSIQRLKRQKQEAEDFASSLLQKVEGLERKIDQMGQQAPSQAQSETNDDLSRLQHMAFSNDPTEIPEDQARYALHELFMKKMEGMESKILGQVNEAVNGRFQTQQQYTNTERQILDLCGPDALNPQGDMARTAMQILARDGVSNSTATPDQWKTAFLEANARLGQVRAEDSQTETPPPTEIQGTPASTGTADYTAAKEKALQDNDPDGAIKAMVGNMYGS